MSAPGIKCSSHQPDLAQDPVSPTEGRKAICRSADVGRLLHMKIWDPESGEEDPLELACIVWRLVAATPKSATEKMDDIGDLGLIYMFFDLVFALVQDARAQRSILGKYTVGDFLDLVVIELAAVWCERPDLGRRQYMEQEWALSELKEEILRRKLIQ